MKTQVCIASIFAVSVALACASSDLSQTKLVNTQSAIQAAKELNEQEDPRVSLHIKFAEDQFASAKKLLDDGDEEPAGRMLDRALADAELALVLARTEMGRAEAQRAWDEVRALREDTNRES